MPLPDLYTGGRPARADRKTRRAAALLSSQTQLALAELRALEHVEAAKVEVLGSVASSAQDEAVYLSMKLAAHAQLHPQSAPLVGLITQTAAIALADRVRTTNRRLG